jgi:hypothetical protein
MSDVDGEQLEILRDEHFFVRANLVAGVTSEFHLVLNPFSPWLVNMPFNLLNP